jgi:heavy metal translocating P-type ATPase
MFTRLGLSIFLSMNVMVFTMALWTRDVYGHGDDGSAASVLPGLFRYLCLLFALPVLFLLGIPLFENAWRSLRRGVWTADLLLGIGIIAAYAYSAASTFRDEGPVYFEVGCAVLVLVTLGRWLEATGKLKSTSALESLEKLLPERARIIRGGSETLVPLGEVRTGDQLHVLAGERIPCDGTVAGAAGAVDEQIITGESQAAVKEPGDAVFGGSINLDSSLFVTATATSQGGTFARMLELVRRARESKGHYERLADRIVAVFLPAVALVAFGTFTWHARNHGLHEGILTALAVLLIACPCALGLATPMAIWAALGQAARGRVLFRTGEALEKLACVRAMRVDKTGTLTTGEPAVLEFQAADGQVGATVLSIAATLASASTHTYSKAIREYGKGDAQVESAAVKTLPGRGITGYVDSLHADVFLGSDRLMAEAQIQFNDPLSRMMELARRHGLPVVCIGWDAAVRGVFVLRDLLRSEAKQAIERLQMLDLDIAVLTGDHAARAAKLSEELGIPVFAELLPEAKVEAVRGARETVGSVAMVGDGLNDAPALAESDVGIAMGCGADLSRDSAAVCLLGNDLMRLPWAIELSRRTVRVIRQNLFWAFAYNIAGIGFAVSGRLNPVLAALAMTLSSLLVVGNSLRIASFEPTATAGSAQTAQRNDGVTRAVTTEQSA